MQKDKKSTKKDRLSRSSFSTLMGENGHQKLNKEVSKLKYRYELQSTVQALGLLVSVS